MKRPKSNAKGRSLAEVKAAPFPFRCALTDVEIKFDNAYMRMPGMSEGRLRQLNQNPETGFGAASPSVSVMQCLIKNAGVLFIHNRSLTPVEMLVYQMFPVRPSLVVPDSGRLFRVCSHCSPLPTEAGESTSTSSASTASTSSSSSSASAASASTVTTASSDQPNQPAVPRRSRGAMAGQAGNSMNLAVAGSVLPRPYLAHVIESESEYVCSVCSRPARFLGCVVNFLGRSLQTENA